MLGVNFRTIRRFAREDRGVVLVIFLLVVIPLLLTVAVLIDFSQTLVVKRQLTSAVDSAALALGTLQLPDDELEDKARGYIEAHYPTKAIGSLKALSAARDGNMINISATAEIPTAFLGVTGKDSWEITVNSGVFRKDSKLEVVMVLDNSGSMGSGGKMTAMKDAAIDLVNTLFGADETSGKVKIGLVPFTGGVNSNLPYAGNGLLDFLLPSIINREVFDDLSDTESTWTVLETMEGGIANWNGCLRSRNEPYDILDTPPSLLIPNTHFAAHFKPSNDKGKDKKKYKDKPKDRENDEGCPTARVQPLTNVKSTITSAISAMVADGNTNIPEGLVWGWRLISPQEPFTTGAAYSDQDTIKAVILLTDGDNVVNGVFSSYGQGDAANPHLGPGDVNAALDAKLTALCENLKGDQDGIDDGDDITVYTIAFALSGPTLTRLSNCATNATKAFTADNVAQLHSTFAAIAASLTQLRLAK